MELISRVSRGCYGMGSGLSRTAATTLVLEQAERFAADWAAA